MKTRALLAAAFVLAATPAVAQPVWFTGDVEADFDPAATFVVPDPAGIDVGVPPQFPVGTVSGNDIEDLRISYDAVNDTLYVGFNTYRIGGDVDGDGDPSGTSAILASIGGRDMADFGGTEAFTLAFDIDEDGDYDVVAGVSSMTDLSGFTVAEFIGSPFAPGFGFGETLHDHVGAIFGSPSAAAPHIEFTILRFSALLGRTPVDASASFGVNAFMGSFGDAGIGEDHTPGVARTIDICLTPDAVDVCNDFDDDCDGRIDEDATPTPTVCGRGNCAARGVEQCIDGELVDTCAPGEPSAEVCNGEDDDCDGRVDDGVAPEATTCGVGACGASGTAVCVDGARVDDCTPGAPGVETCDGTDEDCDGRIDEGVEPTIVFCGRGACLATGIRACVGGDYVDTCTPGEPSDEVCDGLDNDCDGRVDDDIAPVATTCGVGACGAEGTETCVDGALVDTCAPGAGGAETCNGVDDDCDGRTDEGVEPTIVFCGQGTCRAMGTRACVGGALVDSCTPGAPLPEVCDGVDNDCDGQIDDGVGPVATACGVGACGATGTAVCVDGARVDDCEPGVGKAESCNGIDDDCDGAIDEDVDHRPITCGVGACGSKGVERCIGGMWLGDCNPGTGSNEACNGIDDDCDGVTDEAIAPRPTTCGAGACAAAGERTCQGGVLVDDCAPGAPGVEECNGSDDDCDGAIDEGIAPVPSACGEGACAAVGEITCVDGALVDACTEGAGRAERCNGIDDDCDGDTDEDLVDRPVRCGVGACAAEGVERCTDGALVNDCAPGTPGVEVCNDADDDCDGATDEDIAPTPSACGDGVCAATGEVACVDGVLVDDCAPGAGGVESCNGLDDDCDGAVDEDIAERPTACGVGACAADGVRRCTDGVFVDDCAPGAPADELCNDADDDCDGETDEGGRVYRVTNWTGGAYGNMAWDINGDHIWRWSMDDVWMTVGPDGDAVIDGTMSVSVVERGAQDPIGEVWTLHMELAWRGQGPAFGGPKIEDAAFQTPAITDLWQYWDMTAGYMEGPDSHAELVQRPRSGNYPFQIGVSANGKDRDLGAAMWFYYHLVYDDGRSITSRGDLVAGLELVDDDGCPEGGEPEVCDDVDNDLDGVVDEGFGVGDDCAVGAGACTAPGVVVCGPDGVPTCDGEPGQGGPETCNAFDDDCDGFVDEDVAPRPSACGEGACAAVGEIVCDDGIELDTCAPAAGGDELCNDVDDDCDGAVDEEPVDGAEIYAADEYAAGGHAITLGDGVRFHFADDARLAVDDDGARLTGTATAVSGYPAGQEWQMDIAFTHRGQGPAFGGPKIENAPIQPPAVTDLWRYYDLTGGGLTRGDAVISMVQRPADGRFPMQLGATANGKNAAFGLAVWFTWTRTDAGVQTGSGAQGDINIDLDPLDPCAPPDEVCDGLDNDLDGAVDEGFGVGEGCAVGVGACAAEGTVVCLDGDAVCDATPGAPGAERCNGLDDDCDGALDEEIAAVPSDCGAGACAAHGEIVCVDGAPVDTCLPAAPGEELCNEIDDDCDGEVDEGAIVYAADEYEAGGHALHFVDFALPGITHMELRDDARLSIDRDGVARLTGTAYTTTGPHPAGEEWAVDVTFVYRGQGPEFGGPKIEDRRLQPPAVSDLWHYYTLTEGTLSRPGSTVTLTQAPADGRYPMQMGFAANGKDADYGLASWFDWVRVDADGSGCEGHGDFNLDLDPIGPEGCYPNDEICNGEDDDLDGAVDEGFGLGEACSVGVGACAAEGTTVCLDGDAVCDAAPGAPSAEGCDAVDNDCDGAVDEGIAAVPIDCGAGACAAHGERRCVDGALVDACEPGAPGDELCNDLDDDCDGAIDEGAAVYAADEYAADGHAIDFHADGRNARTRLHLDDDARFTVYTDGTATLTGTAVVFDGAMPAGQTWQLAVEFAYRGQGDVFGGPKIENAPLQPREVTDLWRYYDLTGGTFTRPGVTVTFTQRPADGRYPMQMGQAANGKDGDLGIASWFFWRAVGDDGSRAEGEGDFNLDLDPIGDEGCFPEDEICDGLDNDVDGAVDEDYGVGDACEVGVGACAAEGALVCDVFGGVVCDAEPGAPADEICDDLDNDCDGEVDEGTVSREWRVTEYAGGHALWLPGFNRDGNTVEMRLRDDATFLWHAHGTARVIGTAYISNLGGGPGVLGQEWHAEFFLRYRGQGPDHGGPKIEMPAVQTPEVTDAWHYWDIIGARIIRGDELVHFTQRPVDGSFPFQFGDTANGKDLSLGAAVWFDWHRVDAQGRERRGHGDLNVTMHDEAGVCAEVPIDAICVQHCEDEGDRHMEGCLQLGYPRAQCEALLEPWLEQCVLYQCC